MLELKIKSLFSRSNAGEYHSPASISQIMATRISNKAPSVSNTDFLVKEAILYIPNGSPWLIKNPKLLWQKANSIKEAHETEKEYLLDDSETDELLEEGIQLQNQRYVSLTSQLEKNPFLKLLADTEILRTYGNLLKSHGLDEIRYLSLSPSYIHEQKAPFIRPMLFESIPNSSFITTDEESTFQNDSKILTISRIPTPRHEHQPQ